MRWSEEQLKAARERAAAPLVLNHIPRSLSPTGGVDAAKHRLGAAKQTLTPAKQALPAGKAAELSLRYQIVAAGLPAPFREFTFDDTRDWRLDLAWPSHKLAVEIDGSVHRTKERFARDIEKHNALMFHGWRYLRVAPVNVETGTALDLVKLAFERLTK